MGRPSEILHGKHDNANGIDQLRTAIEKFNTTLAILITTVERTQTLETAFNNLAEEMNQKMLLFIL